MKRILFTLAAVAALVPAPVYATGRRVEKIVVKEQVVVERVRFVDRFRAAIVVPTQPLAIVGGYSYGAQFVAPVYSAPVYQSGDSEALRIEKERTKQEQLKTEAIRLQLQAK